jgi:uncharacterized protein (DUF2062 family)
MGLAIPENWTDIQSQLRAAVTADRSPHFVSLSFGFGLYLIALPNFGVSLVVLAAIAYRFDWADSRAFSAAAMILNPFVKSGVYVGSFIVGSALLGSIPGGFDGLSLEMSRHVLARLLVGNVLIAGLVAVLGYLLIRYAVYGRW